MSDRIAQKLKIITGKKTPKERLQVLVDLQSPPGPEALTADEADELFRRQSNLVIQIYREHMAASDSDATRGRLLSVTEAVAVLNIAKDLLRCNAEKVAQDQWEVAFFESEALKFLHQENHCIVRRHAFELLTQLIHHRARSAAPSAQGAPQDGAPQQAPPSASTASPSTFQLLLSALDWDYLRASYTAASGSSVPVTLPGFITEVRRGRHDSAPARARYASSDDEERHRECAAMIRAMSTTVLATPTITPSQSQCWIEFLFQYALPLFFPLCAVAVGVYEAGDPAALHGFQPSPHKRLLPLLIDTFATLNKMAHNKAEPNVTRLQAVLFDSTTSVTVKSMVLSLLADAYATPSVEHASTITKALTTTVDLLLSNGASEFTAAYLKETLVDRIWGQHAPLDATSLLLPPPPWVTTPAAVFQGVVEEYGYFLYLLATNNNNNITTHSGSILPKSVLRCTEILCGLACNASTLAVLKPTPVVEESANLLCKFFWVAAFANIPPHTADFSTTLIPILHKMEDELKHSNASAVPCMYRMWSYLLGYWSKVFLAPDTAKNVAFQWPPNPLAAAAPSLTELRSRRLGVPQSEPFAKASQRLLVAEPFGFLSETLHAFLLTLSTDSASTSRAKCSALCDLIKLFCDGLRQDTTIVFQSSSLLKVVLPYLIFFMSTTAPPACRGEATEALAEIISTTFVDKEQSADNDAVFLPFSIAVETLGRELQNNNDAVLCSRVLPILFRGQGSASRHSSHFFTAQIGLPIQTSIAPVLHRAACAGLRHAPQSRTDADALSRAASLECLLWTTTLALATTDAASTTITIAGAAIHFCELEITGGSRHPVVSVIFSRVLSTSFFTLFRIVLQRGAWHDSAALSALLLHNELLLGLWNVPEKNTALQQHIYAATLLQIETLEEAMKTADTQAHHPIAPLFVRFVVRRVVTALCGILLQLLHSWAPPHAEAVLMLLHCLGDLLHRVGHLALRSANGLPIDVLRNFVQQALQTTSSNTSPSSMLLVESLQREDAAAAGHSASLTVLFAETIAMVQQAKMKRTFALEIPMQKSGLSNTSEVSRCCGIRVYRTTNALAFATQELQTKPMDVPGFTPLVPCSVSIVPDNTATRWGGALQDANQTLVVRQLSQAARIAMESVVLQSGYNSNDAEAGVGLEESPAVLSPDVGDSAFWVNERTTVLTSNNVNSALSHVVSHSAVESIGWELHSPSRFSVNDSRTTEATGTINALSRIAHRSGDIVLSTALETLLSDFPEPQSIPIMSGPPPDKINPNVVFPCEAPPPAIRAPSIADPNNAACFLLSMGSLDAFVGKKPSHTLNAANTMVPTKMVSHSNELLRSRTVGTAWPVFVDRGVDVDGANRDVQSVAHQCLSAFGKQADDEGCLHRHASRLTEVYLRETSAPLAEIVPQTDALICVCSSFLRTRALLREIKEQLGGRSFTTIFIVAIQNGKQDSQNELLQTYVARQGESAPQSSPFLDGGVASVSVVSRMLRTFCLSSLQAWKQPLTDADAKRRQCVPAKRTVELLKSFPAEGADSHGSYWVSSFISSVSNRNTA